MFCTVEADRHEASRGLFATAELLVLISHVHSTPPLRDPRRNIAVRFCTEKLEWSGYRW